MWKTREVLAVLTAAACLCVAAPAAAQPVKLRINYSVVPPHLVPVLFQKKDLIKHEGKSYTTDFIYTGGSSLVLQAMAANEMDLGVFTMNAFAAAVQNAKLPLVAIADLVQDGPWFTAVYGVKADSPIRTVQDLKGKSIAINVFGGGHDVAVRAMLVKSGLVPGRDVQIVEARFPAQPAMLREGKVDAATFIAAFWHEAKKKGDVRPLFTMKDAIGDSAFLFWAAKKDLLKQRRAVLVDFFEDYIRAQRWFLDPANRKEALELIAKFAKKPPETMEWELREGTAYYRGKDLRIDHATLQRTADALHSLGFMKEKLDTEGYIDESIIIEAAKRLQ
jgi:NitT/TauT family transport system substrate-binding protein